MVDSLCKGRGGYAETVGLRPQIVNSKFTCLWLCLLMCACFCAVRDMLFRDHCVCSRKKAAKAEPSATHPCCWGKRQLWQPAQPECNPNLTQATKSKKQGNLLEVVVHSNQSTTTTNTKKALNYFSNRTNKN